MSFDKLKSFWNRNNNKDQSLTEKSNNFFGSSYNKNVPTSCQSTSEFDEYINILSSRKPTNHKKRSGSASLRPQLLKKCFQKLDETYLNQQFQIDEGFFQRNKKVSNSRQNKMQDQLDQIQICLFNQISSRFDEILSVIRTVQSLQFLVVDNQHKIHQVRQHHFTRAILVAQKQKKILKIQRRQQNLKKLLYHLSKLKSYKVLSAVDDQQLTDAEAYKLITTIRQQKNQYNLLKACKTNIDEYIQSLQSNLKRSFSDKLNQILHQYYIEQFPYKITFWKKFINKADIFEDKEILEGTAFLDQSLLNDDYSVIVVKIDDDKQKQIMNFVSDGWKDGYYDNYKLKCELQEFIAVKMEVFLLDFRNFCHEACQDKQITIQNPSLPNILEEMSAKFCAKVFTHFFQIHKTFIFRLFNESQTCLQFIYKQQQSNILTIEQKQKLKFLGSGFINCGIFLINLILTKLHQTISFKQINQSTDIADFKEIITVYEDICSYFESQLFPKLQKVLKIFQNSQIYSIQDELSILYSLDNFKKLKQQKIIDYLEITHRNTINVQLKQKLEDETWNATDVPTFYYDSLHYLITGESLNLRRNKLNTNKRSSVMYETSVLMESMYIERRNKKQQSQKIADFRIIRSDIIIKGKSYKVTETVLLLIEMVEDYMTLAQLFPSIKQQIGIKLNQIFRSYNASSSQLILHRGALSLKKINSKSIKAKHLALSSVSLSFLLLIMEFITKRISIFDYDKLKSQYEDHIKIIVDKLNWILIDKSKNAGKSINLQAIPSKGTEIIVSNAKILYQILSQYYDDKTLQRVFTEQLIELYIAPVKQLQKQIKSKIEAESFKSDILFFFQQLSFLETIMPTKFEEYRIQAQDIIKSTFQNL